MMQNRRITDYDDVSATVSAGEDADLRQFVSFVIGEQHYCVDIMAVREIKAWTGTTALPNSPAHIRGTDTCPCGGDCRRRRCPERASG
jgi:chemotaxis signal transduction protein